MAILRRILLVLVAALFVWRIASTGIAGHYVVRMNAGSEEAASKVLAWNPRQPDALYVLASTSAERDPEATADNLRRAYRENPADARPVLALADLAEMRGDRDHAEALVRTAVNLAPADPRVHKRAAMYWASRGNFDQSLRHWSHALENDPGLSKELFPLLLKLAEDPSTRPAFEPFAAAPPSWWEPFFATVAEKALDVDTVRRLHGFRRASSEQPIGLQERQAYVARLKKDGIVAEAYVNWINGLSTEQRKRLGLIHDGGFELEPGNWGFDWRIRSTRGALVDRAHTYGVDGETALHILFENNQGRFGEVSQSLFLDPGSYLLAGRVRTDSLKTDGGLKWVLRCLLPEESDLGESDRFLGSNEWRDFSFEFDVPTSCSLQEIRLVSAGTRKFEHKINGGAWFDRLAIRKSARYAESANTGSKRSANEPRPASEPTPTVPYRAVAATAKDPATAPVPEKDDAPLPKRSTAPDNKPAPEPVGGEEASAVGDVVMEFKATSWVSVRDSEREYQLVGEMKKGARHVLGGKPPYFVIIGNASAVELRIAGAPFDLNAIAKGNVARFTLDPENLP